MGALDLLAASAAVFVSVALILGLLVGSFLNVVIYRLPVMLEREWRAQCAELDSARSAGGLPPAPSPDERFDLVMPRSACPKCRAPITALHNIPIISWLFLRGRCARCAAPISARYPAVEGLTGLLTAAVAWHFGFSWAALLAMALTWFLIALTFIDFDHQLLPDSLTLPLLWLGLTGSLLWGQAGDFPVDLRSAVIGAIAGYVSLWSVYHLFRLLTGKEGMGYGDFKLFAAFGAWLGWQMLLPLILVAALTGALVGAALILFRGRSRATPIPFGPFLAAAGWIMLMWGPALVSAYLGLYARPI